MAPKDEDKAKGYAARRKFTFVDQTDRSQEAFTAHKAVVRSHCMTEVRRRKRVKVTLEKESGSNVTTFTSEWSGKSSWQGTQHLPPSTSDWASWDESQDQFDPLAIAEAVSSLTDHFPTPFVNNDESDLARVSGNEAEAVNADANHPATTPAPTILGTSRVDPFRPLPIPADRNVHHLVDHYTVTIPFLIYGTRTRNPVQHQLYNIATQDPAAFHAILAYAARQWDSMRGSQASKNALSHSSRTLRLVYERIKEPAFKCEDGLVMAVALLAFAERRFGDDAIAQQHWLALREILKSRGGMAGLHLNRWLAATLYWNCLVWSDTSDRSTAPTIEWHSLIASNKSVSDAPSSDEFTHFMATLARAKVRLLQHALSGCTSPSCPYSCARRRTVFVPMGPLYKLVAIAPGSDSTNIQRTASACQLPCLLYLNIVVLEYATNPSLLEHYLGRLMVCIYEDSLDINVSAEHLLIKLLIGLEESTSKLTRRAHQTIRMAAVVHEMSAKARERVHGALLEALVLPETDGEDGFGGDLLGLEADWEAA